MKTRKPSVYRNWLTPQFISASYWYLFSPYWDSSGSFDSFEWGSELAVEAMPRLHPVLGTVFAHS
ncbi:hypothetical protein [Roseimaritima multifibrata]|uniref:hypothetical protein n=1 Tax=Roseimaritima multifibrata TaxID=1930274 RepID=UPI0011A16C04|nr:hypothetical protein [Roseimaritima multifibrata]